MSGLQNRIHRAFQSGRLTPKKWDVALERTSGRRQPDFQNVVERFAKLDGTSEDLAPQFDGLVVRRVPEQGLGSYLDHLETVSWSGDQKHGVIDIVRRFEDSKEGSACTHKLTRINFLTNLA